MSKKNGQHKGVAERVRAALAPKTRPPAPTSRARFVTMVIACDMETGHSNVAIVSPDPGALSFTDLYAVADAARRYVMAQEQRELMTRVMPIAAGEAGTLAQTVTTETLDGV